VEGSRGDVRAPVWAGRFYPSDPEELRQVVTDYLDQPDPADEPGSVVGLVAPHAGYIYSGEVAGYAYAAVRGRAFERVVVLSPSHSYGFSGAALWPSGGYRTPLGTIPVDEEVSARLLEKGAGAVVARPKAHLEEHSLEVQLPFLQVALESPFRLVPLVLGTTDLSFARNLARLLAEETGRENTLYVASSDLSHYHPYDDAIRIDALLLDLLERMELEKLADALESGKTEACGAGPILTVGAASRDHFGAKARFLRYANSGDTAGDKREVVGYASFAFFAEE